MADRYKSQDFMVVYGIRYSVDERNSWMSEDVFAHKEDAEVASKGIGAYGDDGTLVPMRLYNSIKEFRAQKQADALERAKKKLSTEELEALRSEKHG